MRSTSAARCGNGANAVVLVFLPTYSSWLNRIECEFSALRYFALNGTDHRPPTDRTAYRCPCPASTGAAPPPYPTPPPGAG